MLQFAMHLCFPSRPHPAHSQNPSVKAFRKVLAVLAASAAAMLSAQDLPQIESADALGIWDFDSAAIANRAEDSIYGTPILMEGSTVFSVDGAGRGGQSGDRAMDFGTGGGTALLSDPAFMALLNQSNGNKDQLSIVFWQRWNTAINSSSTIWFNSAASGGSRGLQAHVPWSDGSVYFDTSGCCESPTQRLNAGIGSLFSNFNWQQWHHVALIKNGRGKQIWINGQLLTSQSSGVAPLLNDWTDAILGQQPGSALNTMKGLIDDFAIFGTALAPEHVQALAAGVSPSALVMPLTSRPPRIDNFFPANGAVSHPPQSGISFTASTYEPNEITPSSIRVLINGSDVSDSLNIGGTAQERTISYSNSLVMDRTYAINVEVTDQAGRVSTSAWSFDTADPATTPTHGPLDLTRLGAATQSGGTAANPAANAIDNNPATFSQTPNLPGAFWEYEMTRPVRISRISVVAPSGAATIGVLGGAVLRVYNLRDQLLFEIPIGPITPGSTWTTFVPPGIDGRIVRIELPDGQTNGAGDYRIALAELRISGDPSPAMGPVNLPATANVTQSSTATGLAAALAIDGNPATFSETANTFNSHWMLTLDRPRTLNRVELLNRNDSNSTRLGGLIVRLLDAESNSLAVATVVNPGAGKTWEFDVPAGTPEVKFIRIGLESGGLNAQGNRIVSLAEVSVFTGINHALGKEAYMVRLTNSLPPPGNANDGDPNTFTETTTQTVDGYWETDLGASRSLHSVRAIAFDSGDHQIRLSKATVRLFDEDHNSVFFQRLEGSSAIFDVALPGPIDARYVRIGYERKQRSSPTGGIEWWLRLREVQAFGEADGIGTTIHDFASSSPTVGNGESTTLSWRERGLKELSLHPDIGSVGAFTAADGNGFIEVQPTVSTQYILIGTNQNKPEVRFATVLVNGEPLPPRISEFVANNQLSLRDGHREAPDWIEIHNPNATPLDLAGYGLSDNPSAPFKWTFPEASVIAPHGFLIVFASGRDTSPDAMGYLHADFSLASGGESVVLTDPGGLTADAILNYPPQDEDLAYGRDLNGVLTQLATTPGGVNLAESFSGWLEPPVFSHSRGFQDKAFSLTITNPNPGSQLLVSVNGSEPTLNYTGPIAVSGSITVRAKVVRNGYRAPRTDTHTYLFRSSVMSSPLMNTTYTTGPLAERLRASLLELPTVCVSVPNLPDDYNEREASVEIILPDGSAPVQLNAGMNRVGGSWTNFSKKSYRLSFRSRYGGRRLESSIFQGFDRGIPAIGRIDTLDLKAGNHDMEQRGFYMSNRFVEDAMLEMGSLNPHGRFVHVYINGVYAGQYNAHERLDDTFLADYLGGRTEDYVVVRGNDNVGDNFVLGTPEPPNREPWDFVRANRQSYSTIKDRLDVSHLIDFMLLWFYGNCESEFRCAGPIEPGSGFKFWMADADGFLRTSALTLDRTSNPGPGGLFGALVSEGHPDFKILLADRIQKHFFNNGALTPARNLARLDARMAEVRDSLIAECARWGFRTPSNWESAAETIRTNLFPQRTANLFNTLRNRGMYPALNAPVLSQNGGSVAQGFELGIGGSGTVYYTLDGSDPRLPGGGVSPTAQSLTGAQASLLAINSVWRYRDQGTLPAANWFSPGYNDSAWPSGAAPLGYGSGDEATVVSFGPSSTNKYRTTYFRRSFSVSNPGNISELTLNLIRDDGAVVYLNGSEIARNNMPAGTIGNTTFASATVSGDSKYVPVVFSVPANLLIAGNNVMAVEVHQVSANSGDMRFDLSLTDSTTSKVSLESNSTVKTRALSNGTWSALSEASFHIVHPLIAAGPYVLQGWAAEQPAGSYPSALRFFQSDMADPGLDAAMDAPWTLAYDLQSRSRINGLGADGIAFINTGNIQPDPGAGHVGAAVLALDTQGAQDIRVRWTGGTVLPNDRDYGIRLQYRIGGSGGFVDVTDSSGNPVEYLRSAQAGHSAAIGPVALPQAAEDKALVELRWKYYFRSGSSGPRPQLRLDDIQVTAGPVLAESLVILASPANAQAGALAGPVTVQAYGRNGAVADAFSGTIQLTATGTAGSPGGTLEKVAVNGRATFDDIVFSQAGLADFTVSSAGLEAGISSRPTRVVALAELVMPRFIQARQPENNERVPFASLVRLDGLLPGATYRYANQMVTDEDGPLQIGAGNMIFPGEGDARFVRSTSSPGFAAGDLNIRHGEFVTDASGSHLGWFITEPSGSFRFTPGNTLLARILLNDGQNGEFVAHSLTAATPVSATAFGTAAGEGSAIFGESAAAAKNFMVLYDDPAGTTPPLAATVVEDSGAEVDSRYAEFYRSQVAGQSGRWGALVPNFLPAGVRRFEERDLRSGEIVGVFIPADDHLPTLGLESGLVATGLRIPAPDASQFAAWLAGIFPLSDLNDPALGGPLGDADGDGISNVLEFAFGLNPQVSGQSGLPSVEIAESGDELLFHYRRLLGGGGMDYLPETSIGIEAWADAGPSFSGAASISPNADGRTETVTRRLRILPEDPHRFLRIRVQPAQPD